MIRVIIDRRIKEGSEIEFWEIASQLRTKAVPRPGYVSGETWIDEHDPTHCIVISTWLSLEAWEAWNKSSQRQAISATMESLLAEPAITTVLRPPQGVEIRLDAGMPVG